MNSIVTTNYTIYFNKACYPAINQHIKQKNYSKIFVLIDENTHELCLPSFLARLETTQEIELIEIESGEINKTIETCLGVWNALSELDGDRKSLLINLGGGVITDLGGFVASTFKRGIDFINVPTTLLSMVDASVGGKTGVDLGSLKNQIGVINNSEMVLIDTQFLKTLPKLEMRSGLAEMYKHGLISNRHYWSKMTGLNQTQGDKFDALIRDSVEIKKIVVEQDPFENNLRKTLNYGHTIGHAIESYYLKHPKRDTLLHGEAIAIGMVLASYISHKQLNFPLTDCENIKHNLQTVYGTVEIPEEDYKPIIELLKFDKKNTHGNINFVLLTAIGTPKIDCLVSNTLIIEAFTYYKKTNH